MAGAGAKLFVDGTILDAVGINTYLMDQAVMRFASTAARDAAFGGAGEPVLAEGMFAYTDDTNTLWFYTGSAWEVATIKPSLVDAKGDLIAGTAADTVDRLAVGTNGQVLTANSSTSTGLQWQSLSTQTVTLIETLTPSAAVTAQFTTGSISSAYSFYTIFYVLSNGFSINLRRSGSTITAANYNSQEIGATTGAATVNSVVSGQTSWALYDATTPSTVSNSFTFFNYAGSASQYPTLVRNSAFVHWSGPTFATLTGNFQYNATQAVDSLLFTPSTGTLTGTIKLYGWV
jgi:hypothetical protein